MRDLPLQPGIAEPALHRLQENTRAAVAEAAARIRAALDGAATGRVRGPSGAPAPDSFLALMGVAVGAHELLLDGSVQSRAEFPALWAWASAYARVSSEATWQTGDRLAFSSGDGATTFRLPDSGSRRYRIRT